MTEHKTAKKQDELAEIIFEIKKKLPEETPKESKVDDFEKYCKTLAEIGDMLLSRYFNNATDMIESIPWGKLKGPLAHQSEYTSYKTEILSDEDLQAKRSMLWRGIKLASQERWLNDLKIKGGKSLDYTMRDVLLRLKNGNEKKELLGKFVSKSDKISKSRLKGLVTADIKRTKAEKKATRSVKQKVEEPLKKPTIASVTQAVKDNKILEILTDERYLQYVLDPKHFMGVKDRDAILSILERWKSKADMFKDFGQNLEGFYHAVRSGGMLGRK